MAIADSTLMVEERCGKKRLPRRGRINAHITAAAAYASGMVHVLIRVFAAVRSLVGFKMVCACMLHRSRRHTLSREENHSCALIKESRIASDGRNLSTLTEEGLRKLRG